MKMQSSGETRREIADAYSAVIPGSRQKARPQAQLRTGE
jgi:hypothetical protein